MNNEMFRIQAMLFAAANGSGTAASVGDKVGVNSSAGHSAGTDWTGKLTGSDNIGNPALKTGDEGALQDFRNTLKNTITAQTRVRTQAQAKTANKQGLKNDKIAGLYSLNPALLAEIAAAGTGKVKAAVEASLNGKLGLGPSKSGGKLQAAGSQAVNVNSTVSGVHVVLPTSQDAAENIKAFLSGLRDQLVEAGSGPKQGKSTADTASEPDSATPAGNDKVTVKPTTGTAAGVNLPAAAPTVQAGEHADVTAASEMSGKAAAGQKTKVAGNLNHTGQKTDQDESAFKSTLQNGKELVSDSTKVAGVSVSKGGVLSDAKTQGSKTKGFDLGQKSGTSTRESASETGKEMTNPGKASADDHVQVSSEMLAGNSKTQPKAGPNKLNIEQQQAVGVEISGTAGKKGSVDILSKGFDGAGSEQNYSYGDSHSAVGLQQTSVFTQGVKVSSQPLNSNAAAGVGEQIRASISSSLRPGAAEQEINIRLNPPELGMVSIKFQQQQGQIVGSVKVSNETTRYEIEQALPQIVQNLSEQGIQIKRMNVTLSDRDLPEEPKDQSLQNGAFQQRQGFYKGSDSDSHEDTWSNDGWLINDNNYQHDTEFGSMSVNEESLSVLV